MKCLVVILLALSTQALGLYLDAKIASTTHQINAWTESLPLSFALTNTHATSPIVVCIWGTPLDNLKVLTANMFNVSHSTGKQAEYIGILAKRRPALSDFITLGPGQTIESSLDLLKGYWFPIEGTYDISLSAQVMAHLGSVNLEEVVEDGFSGFQPHQISSEPIALRVAGIQQAPAWMSALHGVEADVVTQNCTANETGLIDQADKNGGTLALGTRNYVQTYTCASASVYQTWMGACNDTRYKTVTTNYQNIYTGFQNARKVDCKGPSCSPNTYAYVYPADKSHTIYVCGVFWNVALGTCQIDSKPGTLVHEMSHFSDVAGTQDYAYGTASCKSLAISNPTRAIANADNYEYFAESCPS